MRARNWNRVILLSIAGIGFGIGIGGTANAATPPSGTISADATTAQWQGTLRTSTAAAECTGPNDPACDHYQLTVVPPTYDYEIRIALTMSPADDWDLNVFGPDGSLAGTSGNSAGTTETVTITAPVAGIYTVSASPFAVLTPYSGRAEIRAVTNPPPPPPGTEPLAFRNYAPVGLGETDPGYLHFAPARGDSGIGLSAGEPTLGVPASNNLVLQQTSPNLSRSMFISGVQTLRLETDVCTSPAIGTWRNRSSPTHVTTLDPILHVQPETSRTISTQLAGKRSIISLSDDDGETWMDSPQGAGVNSGVDHQTVGGGPYSPTDPLGTGSINGYGPYATYYASQDIAIAQAAQSRDGGLTWGAAVPMYNLTQCGGLHGHVQVSAANGTVFVPNGNCPLGQSGFARSTDGGTTWSQIGVPGTAAGDDPGMAVGSDGTVYFGTCNNNSDAVVSVSQDNGATWAALVNVSANQGLRNCVLPTMVAGDGDRAAFFFLGSTEPGAAGTGADPAAFDGVWYGYVAVTYDRGATWTTVGITPDDPVQRGPVCLQGTTCESNRNLLDFNDIQLDEKGRILAGYSDGCIGGCVTGAANSGTDLARIARQEPGSRGLLAAFDNELVPSPARMPDAPYVDAFAFPTQADGGPAVRVELTWTKPFNGGSPVTGYRIFRRTAAGTYGATPLATIGNPDTLTFSNGPLANGDFCYRVLADNAVGASAGCFETCAVTPPLDNICTAPFAERALDPQGDGAVPHLDIRRLALGEPFLGDPAACSTPAPENLLFNLKVDSAAATTAGNAWLIIWNRQNPVPDETGAQTYDRQLVSIRSTGASVSCSIGKVTAPSVNQGNDQTPIAAANCQLRTDGNITVIVPTAEIDDCKGVGCSIGPGYELAGLEVRTFAANASGQSIAQASSSDFANGLSYQLMGNEVCRPDLEPVAVDDNIAVNLAQSEITLPILANDRAGDCDTISLASVGTASFGTVSIDGDNAVYTPTDPANPRADQFSYTITDGGKTDQGVVRLCHLPGAGTAVFGLLFADGFEETPTCPSEN